MQGYSTAASRNLIRAESAMLDHAAGIEVLGRFGMTKPQPQRKTDTVVFRRLNPYNMNASGAPNITASSFILSEGATPPANTVSYTDVSVTLQQYGILYKFSSKVELMYEDDIPEDMKTLVGETMGEVAELIRYGAYKAGTSVVYANGASRAAVNTAISLNKLRAALRQLENARAKRVNKMLSASADYGTSAISAGFPVFVHTDLAADIRGLSGFVPVEKYGSGRQIHERELGAVEEFRFITSPLLLPFYAAGSGTLNGMMAADSTNVDVYPVLIMAQDCWASVPLRGHGAASPTVLPAGQKSHANPLGQFGYVGASFWMACKVVNENWMTRLECGATAL